MQKIRIFTGNSCVWLKNDWELKYEKVWFLHDAYLFEIEYYSVLLLNIYFIVLKKYMAFYRIKDDYIEVIRIIYEKRDYMQTLFGDNSGNCN